jgi:zinc protease
MQTVRERDGLTYGVRSSLKGFDDKLDGYLRVWGTFAPNLLMRGIDTLARETALFLKAGLDESKLAAIKEEIEGSYAVSLSTTAGLAMRVVRFMEDDRPLSYIDEYPAIVGRVTQKETRDAAAYLASLPLSIATAGSF